MTKKNFVQPKRINNSISVLGIKLNRGSKAEKVLRTYEKVDAAIDSHYLKTGIRPICHEGCGECCHEHFPISEIEYDLILAEISKWDNNRIDKLNEQLNIEVKYMLDDASEFIGKIEKTDNFNRLGLIYAMNPLKGSKYKCVFLNCETEKCDIYNVRPLICRTFGTSFYYINSDDKNVSIFRKTFAKLIQSIPNQRLCSKISNNKKAKKWQADISILQKEIDDINIIRKKGINEIRFNKQFPIIYFLYRTFYVDKSGFNINNFKLKFIDSEDKYIESQFGN